jgi:hypothetical protein
MRESVFCPLSSRGIAKLISGARARVCYVAPGIQTEVAQAVCSALVSNPSIRGSAEPFPDAVEAQNSRMLEDNRPMHQTERGRDCARTLPRTY